MIIALLAATVLMAEATPAAAPMAAPAAAAAPSEKPKKEASKLICRNEVTLGSRLPTKKCRTAEQMAEQRADDKAALEASQRNITIEQAH